MDKASAAVPAAVAHPLVRIRIATRALPAHVAPFVRAGL